MRSKRILILLAGIFLCLNFLDFATTMFAVMSGRGVETNPLINWLGGPLSVPAIVFKLILIPAVTLSLGFWALKKYQDVWMAVPLLAPGVAAFGYAAANNLLVCITGAKYCPYCGSELAEVEAADGTKVGKCPKCLANMKPP